MKIGILGGTFNPPHNGHLKIAKTALDYGLDQVIFVVSGNAPHKKNDDDLTIHRLEMTKRLIMEQENMSVSDYEIRKKGICYSNETLKHFRSTNKNDELYFLVGDDSYAYLSEWHNPKEIYENATVLVFTRNEIEVLPPAVEVKMEVENVSSHEIREKIKMGKDVSNLLPKNVFCYIIENNLYK